MFRTPLLCWALLGLLCVLAPLRSEAQLLDVSLGNLVDASTVGSWFGGGLSTADFNLDGWDDVTIASVDGSVKLYQGGPEGLGLAESISHDSEAKGVLWVDIENDGDLDLVVGVLHEGLYLYVRMDNGLLVEQGQMRGLPLIPDWDVRGISARDYDQDLDLDLYICSYHDPMSPVQQENILLQNDGSGYFTDMTVQAGVGNGLQHSFQGSWFDYDGDGYEDLWVINDRSIFPNALYRNLGDGTFYDISNDVGANIGIEAMSATLFDPDNDADWDMYCTNIENNPNVYLRNDAGGYVDVTDNAGIASLQYGWGALAIDLNGDMLEDLMVATYRFPNANPYDNHLYINTGFGTFIDMIEDWPNEQYQLYHLGRLDLDGDLCPDVIGHGNANHAQVLYNTNPDNASRMAVKLVGTTSNAFAIGAEIHVHINNVHQMRQVSAGCDYMTQHTYTQFFGLGMEQFVDSLVIDWPSGLRETHVNLVADSLYTFVEGTFEAAMQPVNVDCPWSAPTWNVPFDPSEVEMTWNGEPVNGPQVVAESNGSYTLEATWWGEYTWSQTVDVIQESAPSMALSSMPAACHGEMGTAQWSTPDASYALLYGDTLAPTGDSLPLPEGVHPWIWVFDENCAITDSIEVAAPLPLEVTYALEHPACFGEEGEAEVEVTGGTLPVDVVWSESDPDHLLPGPVSVWIADGNGCSDSLFFEVVEPPLLVAELTVDYPVPGDSAWVALDVQGGTAPYGILWTAGVWNDGWTAAPGAVGWVVEDAQGCLSVGVSDIAENPLAGVGFEVHPELVPIRLGSRLEWSGPMDGVTGLQIWDRTGRLLYQGVRLASNVDLGTEDPVLIRVQWSQGQVAQWLR